MMIVASTTPSCNIECTKCSIGLRVAVPAAARRYACVLFIFYSSLILLCDDTIRQRRRIDEKTGVTICIKSLSGVTSCWLMCLTHWR